MKELKTKTENLTEHLTEYVETYFSLHVLKATEKAAGVASESIAVVLVGVFGFFFLLLINIGVGYWIGQRLGNMLAGFAIIAGFYGLLMVLIIALRKNVLTPFLRNLIIKSAYE
jgi:apolipoprotein N-acyltransferase